jgi:hypothetical protein
MYHHDVRVDESILEKNIYYNCPNCRAKKINNQHTRPAGPGRLRSWSGPVDHEFQGRLRFSYDSMPVYEARVQARLRTADGTSPPS